ncbi:MAG: galactose-1-phosphate uridylyltransferase [Candidatus Doudnabacteria bacterium]|nr:galactose-1-phosphate uridylyltransferase [Candidatus Doudnabacteria bacterium]
MSEFRQNPVTKSWVLMAPARNKRPDQYKTYSVMHGVPEDDKNCVFCVGNEHLNAEVGRYTSDIYQQVSEVHQKYLGRQAFVPELKKGLQGSDWELRVIPNKFPSLQHTALYQHKEFYISSSGAGDHEVIITRKHNEPVALQSIVTVELSLRAFMQRINELGKHPETAYVQIFHNHGRDAGASVIHPHYQLLATPIVPPHIHGEIMGCQHYYGVHGTDIYGDIIREELSVKHRVVHENEHFVVISAYASRKPFETWILPKRQVARFEESTEEEIHHLSFVLKVMLGQLYTKLSDPPLNFYIHTMPLLKESKTYNEKAFRWHLTIFPRITIWAGFEYATGIPVNPILPEVNAKFLRGEE